MGGVARGDGRAGGVAREQPDEREVPAALGAAREALHLLASISWNAAASAPRAWKAASSAPCLPARDRPGAVPGAQVDVVDVARRHPERAGRRRDEGGAAGQAPPLHARRAGGEQREGRGHEDETAGEARVGPFPARRRAGADGGRPHPPGRASSGLARTASVLAAMPWAITNPGRPAITPARVLRAPSRARWRARRSRGGGRGGSWAPRRRRIARARRASDRASTDAPRGRRRAARPRWASSGPSRSGIIAPATPAAGRRVAGVGACGPRGPKPARIRAISRAAIPSGAIGSAAWNAGHAKGASGGRRSRPPGPRAASPSRLPAGGKAPPMRDSARPWGHGSGSGAQAPRSLPCEGLAIVPIAPRSRARRSSGRAAGLGRRRRQGLDDRARSGRLPFRARGEAMRGRRSPARRRSHRLDAFEARRGAEGLADGPRGFGRPSPSLGPRDGSVPGARPRLGARRADARMPAAEPRQSPLDIVESPAGSIGSARWRTDGSSRSPSDRRSRRRRTPPSTVDGAGSHHGVVIVPGIGDGLGRVRDAGALFTIRSHSRATTFDAFGFDPSSPSFSVSSLDVCAASEFSAAKGGPSSPSRSAGTRRTRSRR